MRGGVLADDWRHRPGIHERHHGASVPTFRQRTNREFQQPKPNLTTETSEKRTHLHGGLYMSLDKELIVYDVIAGLFKHPLVQKIIWLPRGPRELIRLVIVLAEREDRTPMFWPVFRGGFKFDIFCLGESDLAGVLRGNKQLETQWDFSSHEIFNRPEFSPESFESA
jgi:hypothetical protein